MSEELTVSRTSNIYQNASTFEAAQRMATALSKSTLVPKEYQNNIPNCLIALEFAQRTGFTTMMVMQNLYIVHGRPGWSSQFIIAAVNACGRFKPLRFDISGEGDEYGCVAWTEDREGNKLTSSRITIGMAKKEGWYQKGGSKWQTMPEQMLKYRSSSFFGRIYAPDILMGMQTVEELEDITPSEPKDITPALSPLSQVIARAKENKEEPKIIDAQPQEQTSLFTEAPKVEVVEVQPEKAKENLQHAADLASEIVYKTIIEAIVQAKSAGEVDQIMLKNDLDALSIAQQDAINKAAERRCEQLEPKVKK